MPDEVFGSRALVEGDVVEDDDIARRQFGNELGLDVSLKDGGVHRRIDDPWRDEAMTAQASDEGLCLPAAERRVGLVALALRRPARAFGQLGVGRCLIKEDQARQGLVEETLAPIDPKLTRLTDVGALLFAGP